MVSPSPDDNAVSPRGRLVSLQAAAKVSDLSTLWHGPDLRSQERYIFRLADEQQGSSTRELVSQSSGLESDLPALTAQRM